MGDIEVVALCDHSLAQAEQKARQLNVAHAYGSVEDLLAHPGLQVVHNCTPNHLHAEINRQILRAGLHVFSEKPLCMRRKRPRAGGAGGKGRGGARRKLCLPPVCDGPAGGQHDP
ncbi:Uncharacterized oxidoreductase ycjS [Raoultella terrigena]|uniref:Uncharacterized oxidoreductase ycjS n=1 Tax=Raoultella terrigena TaxID=577 RepID=A0A4U9DAY9_RAOTE|nr:Uncharacterized oxidoreductase ycjS [Raoultella terrigena]